MVTKSVGMNERKGYGNPSVVEVEHGLLNAMGLPNPGVEKYMDELRDIKIDNIIGSIFGKDAAEFAEVAKKLKEQ